MGSPFNMSHYQFTDALQLVRTSENTQSIDMSKKITWVIYTLARTWRMEA